MDRSLEKLKHFVSLQAVSVAIFVNSGSAELELELLFKQCFASSATVWSSLCCSLWRGPALHGFSSVATAAMELLCLPLSLPVSMS